MLERDNEREMDKGGKRGGGRRKGKREQTDRQSRKKERPQNITNIRKFRDTQNQPNSYLHKKTANNRN